MAAPVIDVRLDAPLLRALRARADLEGVSLNELIRRLLAEGLKRERETRGVVVEPTSPLGDHVGDDATLPRSA